MKAVHSIICKRCTYTLALFITADDAHWLARQHEKKNPSHKVTVTPQKTTAPRVRPRHGEQR